METKLQYAEEIRRRITIMEAYLEGETIEIKGLDHEPDMWFPLNATKFDNWDAHDYRVKPKEDPTPDTIDWSEVSAKYKFMARDSSGDVYLYEGEPELSHFDWNICDWDYVDARCFASYQEGEVSWDESLVRRP